MAKKKGQQVLIGGVGVDAQEIREQQWREEDDRAEAAVSRCRQALTAMVPDQPTLEQRCQEATATASPTSCIAFLVRCLARVAFLDSWQPQFALPVRRALQIGRQACLHQAGGSRLEARQEGLDLVEQLGVALVAPRAGGTVLCGPAQAALVAVGVLQAVARWPDEHPQLLCRGVAADTMAAVWASSPEPARTHGLSCVVNALHHDLAKCSLLGQTDAPLDPGESGPLGPLWQADVPFLVRVQETAAEGSHLRELTAGAGRSILGPMPGRDQRTEQQQTPIGKAAEDQTSEAVPLSVLDLSPEQAVEFLQLLGADITSAHAALARRFQQLICAVAGKSFDSAEENKRLARLIQDTANCLEIRLGCPDCLNHGTLQYEAGSFRMNHRTTTHSLGTGLPALVLTVPAGE